MKKTALAFGTGILASASLPHAGWLNFVYDATPYSFIPFSLSLGTFLLLITQGPVTRALVFIRSFAWAFGYFLFGLNWVGNALLVPGNDYAWAWPFAFIGLPLILAPFLATTMALLVPLLWRASPRLQPVVFALIFTAAEVLRGHLFTGFPWILPGMFWAENFLVFQSLYKISIYGLTLLTVFWAATLGLIFIRKIPVFSLPTFLLLTSFIPTLIYGLTTIAPGTNKIQIVLVQANIPQSEKWDGEKLPDHFYDHLVLSERPADLDDMPTMIIWPETALPPGFVKSSFVAGKIQQLLSTYPVGSVLVTGALRSHSGQNGLAYYNSVLIYDQRGQITATYDKHHLVPFGEYIPYQNYIPLVPIARFEGLAAGGGPRTISIPNLPRFSPLVCYEVLFSGQVTPKQENPVQLLVNVTNDSWYGNSPGPYQHLMEARARAIEENVPVVRAAGTGISGIFDAQGRLLHELKYNHRGRLTATLSFR